MPWELIYCASVWRAAATPLEAAVWIGQKYGSRRCSGMWSWWRLAAALPCGIGCAMSLPNTEWIQSWGFGEKVYPYQSRRVLKSHSVTKQCELLCASPQSRSQQNLLLHQLWQLQILLIAIDCLGVLLHQEFNSSLAIKMCISTKIVTNGTL